MQIRSRKILTRVLAGLLVVVTVILALRAILNYTTGKKLERYLADAKAQGIALRVKDLIPDCPDAKNGARLWKAAEALLLVEEQESLLINKTFEGFYGNQPLAEATRESLSQLVEKNRRVLDLIIEAADRPCFRYREWRNPVYEADIPHAISMIRSLRLLAIDALLRAEKGDVKGGLNECRAGMRLSLRFLDEPVLLEALIAVAIRKELQRSFNQIASGRDLDPDTLAAWIKDMEPGSWQSRFVRCIPGERALGIETYLEVMKGSPDPVKDFYGSGAIRQAIGWLTRPIFKSQVLRAMSQYQDLEAISKRPYFEQRDLIKKLGREHGIQAWYEQRLLALVSDSQGMFLKEASLEAMMLTTKAGLACKIYKARTGRYPENLEALVPDILPEVPVDPFTGKPLVYKMENGELLIYSLGSNQKDDGGRSSPITQLVMEKDDDWAWREKIK
ncbi:MAG: hypothetical protein ABSG19_14735 [Candidatus Aminicenantales bacterium]